MTRHTTFVHMTDLHVGNPDVADDHLHTDTDATLRAILDEVAAMRPAPDFVVVSGDLANRGDAISYKRLRGFFDRVALPMPVFFALGNHDTRRGFYTGMLDRSDDLTGPYCHDHVIAGLHLIVLDSSVPGKIGGAIGEAQFEWLAGRLSAHPELRKLIVVHHAPGLDEDRPDMEWESISYADTARLAELLAPHEVVGILSGHIHHDRVSIWHGIPVVVGIGQHTALDPLYLNEGLRAVTGASFAIGTIRPSGLTVSFVPQPSERRELHRMSHAEMAEAFRRYETAALAAE